MQWLEIIDEPVRKASSVVNLSLSKSALLGLVDLTSLNDTDTEASVSAFASKAILPWGQVAAVCVYPQFVTMMAEIFANTDVKVATVVNFPEGNQSLSSVLAEIKTALTDGAEEIDVVFPYQLYLSGEKKEASEFIKACKAACGKEIKLKVILETGVLHGLPLIAEVSRVAIMAGADFIKTSTGKVAVGATLPAVAVMLHMIRELSPLVQRQIGLKISGGVREVRQAAEYIALVEEIMGKDWIGPQTLRIGASKLVEELE